MEKHIVDEKTGIPYTLVGDYYLPWGDLSDDESEQRPIGIWGQRHLRYIKKYMQTMYSDLLISGKLNEYLYDIDIQAQNMMERLMEQYAQENRITEQLKVENQMLWVGLMNNIRSCATEVVHQELIYL